MRNKARERFKLQGEVAKFLRKGGKIKKCPTGGAESIQKFDDYYSPRQNFKFQNEYDYNGRYRE